MAFALDTSLYSVGAGLKEKKRWQDSVSAGLKAKKKRWKYMRREE
jgi:hypothetical protein